MTLSFFLGFIPDILRVPRLYSKEATGTKIIRPSSRRLGPVNSSRLLYRHAISLRRGDETPRQAGPVPHAYDNPGAKSPPVQG